MNSDEYEVAMKEYDGELTTIDQPHATQQVFATMMELAGDDTANQRNPEAELDAPKEDADMADAARSNSEQPPNPPPQQDVFLSGTSRSPHGLRDDIARYGELLVTPIMIDRVKEVTRFDGMREELLREAKNIEKTSIETMKLQENALKYQEGATRT
jgi:hypothetical protein